MLGKTLEKHRLAKGLKQIELASMAGLPQSSYSKIESGQMSVAVPQLRAIAAKLGTSAAEILDETEDYARQLEAQGISVLPSVKQEELSRAAFLVGIGVLLALLAGSG